MPEDQTGVAHGEAPIIVKKKKESGHGHHGGAWKVAYADMVTALMALFIVLWILAQSEEVIQNVAGFFRDPVGFRQGGLPAPIEGGSSTSEMIVVEEKQPVPELSRGDVWGEQARRIRDRLDKLPTIEKYRNQIELAVTPEGLRISLIESPDTPLYEVGGTRMHPEGEELLRAIAEEMASYSRFLLIEGHTDSRPFHSTSGMTNWELSTGRAHTARTVLENAGVGSNKILEVRGFADRQLYNALDPQDSRNRRVAITLLSDEAYEARQNPDPGQRLD